MSKYRSPRDMEDDEPEGDELEDDEPEDDEQVSPGSKRTRKPKPVASLPPFERKMAYRIDEGPVRDRIDYAVVAMIEDVLAASEDPDWGSWLAALGEDDVVKYFRGGHRQMSGPGLTPVPKPGPKEKKMTQPQISSLFKKEMIGPSGLGSVPSGGGKPEGVYQLSAWQAGLWKEDGRPGRIEGGRNYTAEFDLLLASSISQTLINRLQGDGIKVTEVQAMVLKDRVLVSANERAAVEELVGTSVKRILATPPSSVGAALAKREEQLKKLSLGLKGKSSEIDEEDVVLTWASARIYPEQASAMDAMAAVLQTSNYVVDAGSDAVGYVTNAQGKNKLILISYPGFCHAEQNLLVALASSGYTGPVTVAGGKRPCAVCHVALALVKKHKCPQLRYVQRHGGGWFGSSRSSFKRLATTLNISLSAVKAMATEILTQEQCATAFEDYAPEEEIVHDLRSRVLSEKVATNMLPLPGKRPKNLVKDYDEYVPTPEQIEKDEQEEEDYEMTPEEEES